MESNTRKVYTLNFYAHLLVYDPKVLKSKEAKNNFLNFKTL